jgi:hypothetical protein
MQPICTHKISVQSAKESHAYPIIRLPREYRGLIGSEADIYRTVHEGKLAFLVVSDKKVDNCCATLQNIDADTCISELESKTDTILRFTKQITASRALTAKIKRPSRDLNPSRSLDRA